MKDSRKCSALCRYECGRIRRKGDGQAISCAIIVQATLMVNRKKLSFSKDPIELQSEKLPKWEAKP
jgi:hypothetical protein